MFRRALKTGLSSLPAFSYRTYSVQNSARRKEGWPLYAKALLGAPPLVLGTWICTSDHPEQAVALAVHFPVRLSRDLACATSIIIDYRSSLKGLDGDQYEAEKRQCHLRSAVKLEKLCFANKGIYIKLGQIAAQLDHLLPEEYVATLRKSMLDQCPVSTFAQVIRTINQELGAPPSVLFAEFDEEPIASASLAQVHRAVGHDGRELAVKVQHPDLLDTYAVDVALVALIVRTVQFVFPSFDYSWLVTEIRNTLPKELDFKHEASNAERCKQNFRSRHSQVGGKVYIPEVLHDLTTSRVLTMEFIRGCKVTEKGALQDRGLRPTEVAQIVSETFNEMIFIFGDVHCDPHAANMLVRADRHGKPQLVLLDHGLYKQLSDDLRLEYAGLWQALVFGDSEGIKRHTQKMNAGEMYPLFAAMLTSRPWEEITRRSADHLYIPRSKEEQKHLQKHAQAFAKEINELLGRMPRDLLLLLKTNECLRAVDFALGQPVNTFIITARECSRALAEHRLEEKPGIRSRLLVKVDKVRTELSLSILRTMTWWAGVRSKFGRFFTFSRTHQLATS